MPSFVSLTAGITVVLALLYSYYTAHDYVHVDIDKGVLRGVNTSTWRGTRYFSFKGIPYARPPVDELRFKAPVEEASWVGVRDAVYHGSVCPHGALVPHLRIAGGQEDCLYLNVYTPSLVDRKLPVMVWIHGGGFTTGDANDYIYGPDYFLDEGVILVTLNYRLGALGFLSTGHESAPGNAGLKDQTAALRWVRRNIRRFGGDPDNVTLFGESAGGASVHYHVLSPMSKGLFTGAIIQSGSALNPWAQQEDYLDNAKHLAGYLGLRDVADEAEIVKYLQTVPYSKIIQAQEALQKEAIEKKRIYFLFVPSVERGVDSGEAFLTSSSHSILKSGKYNKVPLIIGYNSEEGFLFIRESLRPEIMRLSTENPGRYIPNDLRLKDDAARDKLAKALRTFYFGDKNITKENIMNVVNLNSDTMFVAGIHRAVKLQLETSSQPIFYYRFSYDGGFNFLKWVFWISHPGTSHGDDLGYMFYHKIVWWRTPAPGSMDDIVTRTMVRLWTNFAKQGNPTPKDDPVTWRPMSKNEVELLKITGDGFTMDVNPEAERMAFWQNAYENNIVSD